MSQYVKKLSGGGTADSDNKDVQSVKVFKTASGDYDANKLAANFERNIDEYVNYLGLKKTSKDYKNFITEAARIQKGIKDGEFERNEGKIYSGSIISDENKYQSLALGLLDKIIDASPEYTPETKTVETTIKPFDKNGLKNFFFDIQFGGQQNPELKSWTDLDELPEDGNRPTTNRANTFANVLDKYSDYLNTQNNIDWANSTYKTKEEYQTRLKNTAQELRQSGLSSNAKLLLNSIGISDQRQEELFGQHKSEVNKEEKPADPSNDYATQKEILKKNVDADVANGLLTQEEAEEIVDNFNTSYKKKKYNIGQESSDDPNVDAYQDYANKHWAGNIDKSSVQLYNMGFDVKEDKGDSQVNAYIAHVGDNAIYNWYKKIITEIATGKYDVANNNKQLTQNGPTYKQLLYANLEYLLSKSSSDLRPADDHKTSFYIKPSLNLREGSILKWERGTGRIFKVYIQPNSDSYITKLFHDRFYTVFPQSRKSGNVKWNKQGAKLEKIKQLRAYKKGGAPKDDDEDGDSIDDGLALDFGDENTFEGLAREQQAVLDAARVDSTKKIASDKQIPVQMVEANQKKVSEMKGDTSYQIANILRSASTVANVAGTTMFFLPIPGGAQALGGILMAGGAAAEIGADIIDWADGRIPLSEAASNAIIAAVTATMFGKLGKMAKTGVTAASKALKYGTTGMTAFGAGMTAINHDQNKGFWNTLTLDGDMTVEELRNSQRWWNMFLGTMAGANNTAKMFIDPTHGGVVRNTTLELISDPIGTTLGWKYRPGATPEWKSIKNVKVGADPEEMRTIRNADNTEVQIKNKDIQALKDAAAEVVKLRKGKETVSELNEAVGKRWAELTRQQYQVGDDIKSVGYSKDQITAIANGTENGDVKLTMNIDGKDVEVTIPKSQVEGIKETVNSATSDQKLQGMLKAKADPNGDVKALSDLSTDELASLKQEATQKAIDEAIQKYKYNYAQEGYVNPEAPAPFKATIGKKYLPDFVTSVQKRVNQVFDDALVARGETPETFEPFNLKTAQGRQNAKAANEIIGDPGNSLREYLSKIFLERMLGTNLKTEDYRNLAYLADNEQVRNAMSVNDPSGAMKARWTLSNLRRKGIVDEDGLLTEYGLDELFQRMGFEDMSSSQMQELYSEYKRLHPELEQQKVDPLEILSKLHKDYVNDDGITDYDNTLTRLNDDLKAKVINSDAWGEFKRGLVLKDNNGNPLSSEDLKLLGIDDVANDFVKNYYAGDPEQALIQKQTNPVWYKEYFENYKNELLEKLSDLKRVKAFHDRNPDFNENPALANTFKDKVKSADVIYKSFEEAYPDRSDQLKEFRNNLDKMIMDELAHPWSSDGNDSWHQAFDRAELSVEQARRQDKRAAIEQSLTAEQKDALSRQIAKNRILEGTGKTQEELANLDTRTKNDFYDEVDAQRKRQALEAQQKTQIEQQEKAAREAEAARAAAQEAAQRLEDAKKTLGVKVNDIKSKYGDFYDSDTPKEESINAAKEAINDCTDIIFDHFKTNDSNTDDILKQNIRKYVANQFTDPKKAKILVEDIQSTLTDDSFKQDWVNLFLGTPDDAPTWNLTKIPEYKKLGGVLNKIKLLRGGIVKASDGVKTEDPDWYLSRFAQREMLGTENSKRNQFAGESLTSNNHNETFDLSLASKKNLAYINTPSAVTADIQNFYNNHGQNMNIEDFVNYYNSQMQKLRDVWGVGQDGTLTMTNWRLNDRHGARDGSRLFKELYASRSTNEAGPEYNIGYQLKGPRGQDVEDMVGSSFWMRRPDFYRVEFASDTDENKKARIHTITLSNGEKGIVYKKANGDIAIMPASEPSDKPEDIQTEDVKKRDVNGDVVGLNIGSDQIDTKDKLKGFAKSVGKFVNDHKPDFIAFGRYLSNLRNNRRVLNKVLEKRPALRSPIDEHMYVKNGFSQRQAGYNNAAQQQNSPALGRSSDQNKNLLAYLDTARISDEQRMKYDLLSNEEKDKTASQQQNLLLRNYEKNKAVQDFNSASLTESANTKKDYIAQTWTANQINRNTLLMEYEKRLRDYEDELKYKKETSEEKYKEYQRLVALYKDPVYQKLHAALQKANPNSTEWSTIYNALSNYKLQFKLDYTERALAEEAKKYNADIKKEKPSLNISISKQGGTIDDTRIKKRQKDNELIVKQILTAINGNEKALDRLSKAQLLSIRKILS